ncbi:YgaP family membrane protein [Pseudogemmobacter bohemicus]|uniref:YgaP family membrane protein n=1 Tax=Pseudogemmobacter bohemicus TaxID=2250708 RepID=UPI000DD39932|nr:DUF2892 domain-containing protein [Pseudogemmobacter bohemicus]
MPLNIGATDRLIGLVAGVILLAVAIFAGPGGIWPWLIGAVGLVALATAAFRYCPLYTLLGINTCGLQR